MQAHAHDIEPSESPGASSWQGIPASSPMRTVMSPHTQGRRPATPTSSRTTPQVARTASVDIPSSVAAAAGRVKEARVVRSAALNAQALRDGGHQRGSGGRHGSCTCGGVVRTARLRLDVVAALMAVAATIWVACPCVPASTPSASGEHSCCPGGDGPALSAPAADCCADHSLGAAVAATPTAPPLASLVPAEGGGHLPAVALAIAVPAHAPVPFVATPPSVLRI
jgi:hypothetical protein